MKIYRIKRFGKRLEVTYSDKGKKTMQVFPNEEQFEDWRRVNRYVEKMEILAVILGFTIITFFLLIFINLLS